MIESISKSIYKFKYTKIINSQRMLPLSKIIMWFADTTF